jgi:hypothetical protein
MKFVYTFLIACLFLLTGCGSGGSGPGEDNSQPTVEQSVINELPAEVQAPIMVDTVAADTGQAAPLGNTEATTSLIDNEATAELHVDPGSIVTTGSYSENSDIAAYLHRSGLPNKSRLVTTASSGGLARL